MKKIDLDSLDKGVREKLTAYGFDSIPFTQLVDHLMADGINPDYNRLRSSICLPPMDLFSPLPDPSTEEGVRLAALGRGAIDAGQVGAVILNGGMATRFGGMPKGAAIAVDGKSFLNLKINQVERVGTKVPVFLMNSFATEAATAKHLADINPQCEVRTFSQMISIRFTPEGALFFDNENKPSLHAPGHGDLPFALRASGEIQRFLKRGGRWLTVSNVDNLGACLDPLVVGMHMDGGKPMTVEIVKTNPGDVGGFPALVDGKVIIVEAFRAPKSFDINTIPVFNTNTFVFDASALAGDFNLDWFATVKKVDGREAVQFERLVGQLTEYLEATWLMVPRRGPRNRFIPIKVPADLKTKERELKDMLKAQGVS
jgi:UTP--glucose-1-phosphate uridylyltransferase